MGTYLHFHIFVESIMSFAPKYIYMYLLPIAHVCRFCGGLLY